ncbi:MAG: hypothetical protein ABIP50_02300 [Candidatus Saccharimonadales bacterium]
MDIVAGELVQLANNNNWLPEELDAAQDYLNTLQTYPTAIWPEVLGADKAFEIKALYDRYLLAA